MSAPLVTITIDDLTVRVEAGANVVDAAHQAGVEIPVFCHHPYLEPVGMCRMCLVEVGTPLIDRATGSPQLDDAGRPVIRFGPKLVAGCTTPVSEGMVVRTLTPEVSAQRRAVLEFLLTSHPLDCPVCDKGGECPLQNLTMRYGPGRSRFVWADKYVFPKPVPLGPLIALDRERCVLCARCIRFQDEIAGEPVLAFENRARGMEIVSCSEPPFRSAFSGNTSDICPVGALTTVDFRFEARAWEVVGVPGICVHCPVGCNLAYDTRDGRIERVMPRQNDAVNRIWLCDRGRFAHHFASDPDRLGVPMVRRDGALVAATWHEAIEAVADGLRAAVATGGPAAIGGVASAGLANEDLYVFGRLLRGVLGTNNVDHVGGICRDDVIARFGAGSGTDLFELGAGSAVLVVDLDPVEEAPIVHLALRAACRRGARLVTIGGRPSRTDDEADVHLRFSYGRERGLVEALCGAIAARGAPSAAEGAPADGGASPADAVRGAHPVAPEDLDRAAALLAEARDLVVLYGQGAQQAGLVPVLTELLGITGRAGREAGGLVAVGPKANSQGAADMGVLPDRLPGGASLDDPGARERTAAHWPGPAPAEPGLDARAMLSGGLKALYLLGVDPAGEDFEWAERRGGADFLVVHELFLTATARVADVVLPALSPAERDGTMTNMLRRVQRFSAAARPIGEAREDWRILGEVSQRLGVTSPFSSASSVFDEIAVVAAPYAGLSWAGLGAPPPGDPASVFLPFAPRTPARCVEYYGTAYASEAATGAVWPTVGDLGDEGAAPGGESASDDHPPEPPAGGAPRGASGPAEARALTLVPVTVLVDSGVMVRPSRVLWPLVPRPYVSLSPFDAHALGLVDGAAILLATERGRVPADLRVADGVTPGTVLAPRGLAWAVPLESLTGGERTASAWVEPAGG